MIRGLFDFLWHGLPARFDSDYDLRESVRRLTLASVRPGMSEALYPVAEGTVSAERVRLTRVVPGQRSGLPAPFVGGFRQDRGRVVLEGRFALHAFVGTVVTFIGGFTVLAMAMVGAALQQDAARLWWTPGIPLALAAFGLALVAAGRGQARTDAAWLSPTIRGALTAPADERDTVSLKA